MTTDARSTKRLHVLVSVPSGVTGQGGIDRIMGSLRQELERRKRDDIDVRFIASRGSGPVALSLFNVAGFCFRMLTARLAGRADIVHLNVASYGSTYRKLVISACARLLGIPYILHLHGAEYRRFWTDADSFLDRRIRAMFEHARQVVVLGRLWRDFVASRAPGVKDRISVVPNATEIPTLAHVGGGETVHILFLGRVGERKGVPQLIESLHRMHAHPGWRATIAGDGEVEAAKAQAASLALAGRIAFPGWVGPAAVASLIASADILVLPSFAENLPVSVIEGMAAGLAVIATPVGAVEDIVIDGNTGLLVPPGDVSALTGALTRLVNDPVSRERLGKAAQAFHRDHLELAPFAEVICAIWKAAADD